MGDGVLFLSEEDVEETVTMGDALGAIRDALIAQGEGRAVNAPRTHVALGDRRLRASGAIVGDWTAAKVNMVTPELTRTWTMLFDDQAGLRCIAHTRRLGQLRTGAATGVSADVLARPDAGVLTCLGSGFHAYTQVQAITQLRPGLRVIVWSRTPERADAFATRLREELGLDVEARRDAADAAGEGDIVVTMTTASEPVLHGASVKEGAHVALVGSNSAKKREADAELFRRAASVYVDDLEQAKLESGDVLMAVAEGAIEWDRVEELGAAVAAASRNGGHAYRSGEITVFSSHGVGTWDTAIAAVAFRRATELGVGTRLPLDGAAVSRER